jgi:hypothetical protein
MHQRRAVLDDFESDPGRRLEADGSEGRGGIMEPFPLGNYLTRIEGLLTVGVGVLMVELGGRDGTVVAVLLNGCGTVFQLELDRPATTVPRSRPEGCVGPVDFCALVAVMPLCWTSATLKAAALTPPFGCVMASGPIEIPPASAGA